MSTYSPITYIPFKKRTKNAFIGAIALALFILSHYAYELFHKDPPHPSNTPTDPMLQTELWICLASMVILLCGIIVLTQIWVMDKVIIDPKRKTIRVLIRKFDKTIDKGEFDIDDNLKIKISKKQGHGKPITAMRIKCGKKIVFTQSNSDFAGAPNWSSTSFTNIYDEVEHIKKTNFSIPYNR